MNLTAMSTQIADQVIVKLVNLGLLKPLTGGLEDAQDAAEEVLEEQLNLLLSDNVNAMLMDRVAKALRVLAGPNDLEHAVAQNRRALGLPPQCIFCDCAPDEHKDYQPPAPAPAGT